MNKTNVMNSNGYQCTFNMPKALSGEDLYSLPPYSPQLTYEVDDFPSCPENWMKSSGKMKSFFVGVEEDKGMWLDFNENKHKGYHTAILISIQGVNPITGLKQSEPLLERYEDTCPTHGCNFEKNRHCPECGYQWPMQNYLSSIATPIGQLWLDGFRTIEGQIRQYIFTKEKMRGVASNIIGEDRVFAIGITFFRSKEKKQQNVYFGALRTSKINKIPYGEIPYGYKCKSNYISPASWSSETGGYVHDNSVLSFSPTNNEDKALFNQPRSIVQPVEIEKIEIGAGAKIKQSVYNCEKPLSFWEEEPCAQICINYTSKDIVDQILEAGEKDWNSNKDGFLSGIPVGN